MKMIRLNKYSFTKLGTPRSATQEFSINPKNIASIESFRIKGKGGTMITTDGGSEHYVSDEYTSVSKKITKSVL